MLSLNKTYPRAILYLILLISLNGIVVELFRIELLYAFSDFISPVIHLYESIEFRFLLLKTDFYNHYDSIHVNVINIGFYTLLALGTLIRIISKQKKDSLFRFSIMILFLLTTFNSISKIVMLITYPSDGLSSDFSVTFLAIFCFQLILAALSFYYLKKQKTEQYDLEGTIEGISLLRRFLHYLIDFAIMILVCFSLIPMLSPILNPISQLGERFSIWVFILLARMVYYVTTEILFKTSPGKILTGYFVVSSNKEAATNVQLFKRTVLRFIPFEPFSAFKGAMWHDDLSYTGLKRDKSNMGKSGPFFLVIFLLLPVVVVSSYYITKSNSEENLTRTREAELNENFLWTKKSILLLSSEYFIEFAPAAYPYDPMFVKVDSVLGDSIYGHYFSLEYSYGNSFKKSQDFYTANKDLLKPIVLSKIKLKENIDNNLKNRKEGHSEQYALLLKNIIGMKGGGESSNSGNELYNIQTIHLISGIKLKNGSATSSMREGYLTFTIDNEGMSGKIKGLKNLSGPFEWKSSTDSVFESSLSFYCDDFKKYKFYAFEFVVEDLAGRKSHYRINGINATIELKRID